MKKVLKRTGLILVALILIGVGYGLIGLPQALNLTIGKAGLAQTDDGTYSGTYGSMRWATTVEVTVKDHAITDIRLVQSQANTQTLTQELTRRILTEQNTDVDAVSGATASSKCFLKAVENALTQKP